MGSEKIAIRTYIFQLTSTVEFWIRILDLSILIKSGMTLLLANGSLLTGNDYRQDLAIPRTYLSIDSKTMTRLVRVAHKILIT